MILHSRPRAYGGWTPKLPLAPIPTVAQQGNIFTVIPTDTISPIDGIRKILLPQYQEGQQGADVLAKTLRKLLDSEGQFQTDSAVASILKSLGFSDTQSPTDGIRKMLLPQYQDAQQGADALVKTMLKYLDSEGQRQTDLVISTVLKSLGLSDSITVADDVRKTLFKVVLDSIDQDDDLQKTLLKIAGDGFLITDSAALAKVIALALADSVLSADSIARIFLKGIPEEVNATDLLSKILVKVLSDSELFTDSTTLTTVVAGGAAPVFIDSILSAVREVSGRTAGIADPSRRVDAIVDGVRRIVKERGFKR